MRKPASCVLSIALSIVMSVGLITSPAFAELDSTSEPATQSASKSNESPTEATSGQAQQNKPIDASMFSIEDTDIHYTGNPVMPTITSSTVPSDQYTVTYKNNVAIGQATAIVTATDQNYSGTCNIPFEIKPMNAAADYQHSTTAQSGDITLTVQWNDPKLGQETTFHVSATGGKRCIPVPYGCAYVYGCRWKQRKRCRPQPQPMAAIHRRMHIARLPVRNDR